MFIQNYVQSFKCTLYNTICSDEAPAASTETSNPLTINRPEELNNIERTDSKKKKGARRTFTDEQVINKY